MLLLVDNIVSQVRPISHQEFKFIRIELNMSQKALSNLLGVDTQTVARWEKGQSVIPRTADVTLRALYTEFNDDDSQIGLLLNMLSDVEIESTMTELHLEEQDSKVAFSIVITRKLNRTKKRLAWFAALHKYSQAFFSRLFKRLCTPTKSAFDRLLAW